ncbi:CBS domain-containing protein [Lentzea sp. NBRC 102530]|uniref:CBS domain-containing protein n=1 Tax=Lentzea sp. NBRC 102530 TaxID=3032201 RepID=UPI0024A2AE7A|nr:CBS domain-containing protein [Lentzea sp. NBRC 102530]GLY49859.1 hypothetical protein Lesp01_35150 [Lentzea sp. NBRC 102530]
MKAGDVVTRTAVTVGPLDYARYAEGLMDDHGLTVLPVVDGSGFRGVVTKPACAEAAARYVSPRVQQAVSQPRLTAGPGMDADTLFTAMDLYEVTSVPVLDDGRLLGVVTREDVLHALSHDDPHLRVGRAGHRG